jgi:4-hydroxybenzoate polyprenyltransferase
LETELARHVTLDPASLPYHQTVLDWLSSERAARRQLLLVTAGSEALARKIAAHLGIFNKVIAAEGSGKLAAIGKIVEGEFAYAGASNDLELWRAAQYAVAVAAPVSLVKQIAVHHPNVRVFESRRGGWRLYARALRVRQWAKNILVFVPLIAAHQLEDAALLWKVTLSVLLFGLCASAQYVLNDLVDLQADRKHPIKRRRPFACGDVPLEAGFVLAPLLLTASLAAAFALAPAFCALLAGYFAVSLGYSLYFKRFVLLDAFLLSGLYMLRIVAGHLVTGVAFSVWLLSFAFFLFLSLAFSKRWMELLGMREGAAVAGRGYQAADAAQVNLFGVSSAFLSTVVFILYLQGERVKELYRTPELLWFLAPVYLYWVSRVWILSGRGRTGEDPVLMVLTDRASYLVALVAGLILMAASADVGTLFSLRPPI